MERVLGLILLLVLVGQCAEKTFEVVLLGKERNIYIQEIFKFLLGDSARFSVADGWLALLTCSLGTRLGRIDPVQQSVIRNELFDLFLQKLRQRHKQMLALFLVGAVYHRFLVEREYAPLEQDDELLTSRAWSDRDLTYRGDDYLTYCAAMRTFYFNYGQHRELYTPALLRQSTEVISL